jgi:uncharacterized DUF497 family protein
MFTWDARKYILNIEKHGVTFDEAATIFADPSALEWEDLEHSHFETRFKRLGCSCGGCVLIVVYTVRRTSHGNQEIRIISARQASRKERNAYGRQRR